MTTNTCTPHLEHVLSVDSRTWSSLVCFYQVLNSLLHVRNNIISDIHVRKREYTCIVEMNETTHLL